MAGQLTSIALFAILTLGLGYSVLWLARATKDKNPLIALLEIAAVGVATWSFLGPVLDLLRIPLHVTVYLALALACPLTAFIYAIKDEKVGGYLAKLRTGWSTTATACALIAIIAGAFVFWMFHAGAFAYPYLEDDDPWVHGQGTLYIALEHTARVDPAVREINGNYAGYLDPYPPSYDILMGVLRQTNDSTSWTLKFFNALLCGLTIIFAYLAARSYLGGDQKGLFAAVTLAVLPSFMSHFIWSQTLALTIFPIALMATLKAMHDKSWRIVAIITIASMMVTQPVVSFVFGITLILLVGFAALHESLLPKKSGTILTRFPKTITGFIVGAGGLFLSILLYWAPQLFKWTWTGIMKLRGAEFTTGWGGDYALQSYKIWSEVLNPPMGGRIDQAVGFGTVLSIVLFFGVLLLLLKTKHAIRTDAWKRTHLLLWFVLLLYAVLAPTFHLPGWGASRTWAYLAIPLALLAAESAFGFARSISRSDAVRLGIVTLLLVGIVATSLPAKWSQQTNPGWPPGVQWTPVQAANGGIDYPDLRGYIQMSQIIPKESRVYAFCGNDARVIGFDMVSEPWNADVALFRSRRLNHTAEESLAFLRQHGYTYVTFDVACAREQGENETVAFVQNIAGTGQVQQVYQSNGFLLARIA